MKMTNITIAVLTAALLASCNPLGSGAGPLPPSAFSAVPLGGGGLTSDDARALAVAFNAAEQVPSGGPCVTEPTFGALYPRNFTPPLVEWVAPPGLNVFEVRMHVDNQRNDLFLYTTGSSFSIPDDIWTALVANSQDRDILISMRGSTMADAQHITGAVFAGSAGAVHIAPVDATGAIVYWTTSLGSALKGFRIGDKQVRMVLSPELVTAAGKPTTCVGCHSSSPDGQLVFFGRQQPTYSVDARKVDGTGAAAAVEQVTANALANLNRIDQNMPTLSKAHYNASDAVVLTSLNTAGAANKWEIAWTDLHAQTGGTGIIARNGDPLGAANPTWSHDGNNIVYMSSFAIANARPDVGNGDLWTVPYNDRKGGTAMPLPGVNDPASNQYYPTYSPADTFIAFNRTPRGRQMYSSPTAEVWIAPGAGGQPMRVAANDPPACAERPSPGITNSWPRWSPSAQTKNGRHYYWLVFSSQRRPLPGAKVTYPPQLFMSAVVTKDGPMGEVLDSTYPALYIPTQPADESNHTPAWDEFEIPAG